MEMTEEDERWIEFNKSIFTSSLAFFAIIAGMTVIMYTRAENQTYIMYPIIVLIGIGELLIADLGISSAMNIYRVKHQKNPKIPFSQSVCTGAIS